MLRFCARCATLASVNAPPSDLAQRLRVEAAKRRWSGAELARRAGIGQSTVSRYTSGDCEPTAGNLAALAAALGVSIDYLVTGAVPGSQPLAEVQVRADAREQVGQVVGEHAAPIDPTTTAT